MGRVVPRGGAKVCLPVWNSALMEGRRGVYSGSLFQSLIINTASCHLLIQLITFLPTRDKSEAHFCKAEAQRHPAKDQNHTQQGRIRGQQGNLGMLGLPDSVGD